MVIFLKENGWMTKPMVLVFIYMLMGQSMKVNGKMIFRMDMESKLGRMVQNSKETTKKVKSMAKVLIYGLMVANMLVIGLKIEYQEQGFIVHTN